MLKLEDIAKDAALSGVEPGQVVRVVTTEQVGDNALTIYYKTADGLNTNSACSDYIQIYNGTAGTLEASLDAIRRTASEIITAITPDGE